MRCLCAKVDGSQCTRDAKEGSSYCWQHQKCIKPFEITKQQVETQPKQKTEKQAIVSAPEVAKKWVKAPKWLWTGPKKTEKQLTQQTEKAAKEKAKMKSISKALYNMTLFTENAKKGNLLQVMGAVDKGINLHYENETALRNAAEYGHLGVVKYLIEKGADVNKLDFSKIKNKNVLDYLNSIKK